MNYSIKVLLYDPHKEKHYNYESMIFAFSYGRKTKEMKQKKNNLETKAGQEEEEQQEKVKPCLL